MIPDDNLVHLWIEHDRKNPKNTLILLDYDKLNRIKKYRWRITGLGHTCYAIANTETGAVLMHRLIMRAKKGQVVHHKNGNGLDNRRANLKIMTNSAHIALHHKIRKRGTNHERRKKDRGRTSGIS